MNLFRTLSDLEANDQVHLGRLLILLGVFAGQDGTEAIEGLTKLEELWVDDTSVTDAGLEHLRGLTGLLVLQLEDTQVTDEGVKDLKDALPKVSISR